MTQDGRTSNNQLLLNVHEDLIHKRTFGIGVLGFLVHLFRGNENLIALLNNICNSDPFNNESF